MASLSHKDRRRDASGVLSTTGFHQPGNPRQINNAEAVAVTNHPGDASFTFQNSLDSAASSPSRCDVQSRNMPVIPRLRLELLRCSSSNGLIPEPVSTYSLTTSSCVSSPAEMTRSVCSPLPVTDNPHHHDEPANAHKNKPYAITELLMSAARTETTVITEAVPQEDCGSYPQCFSNINQDVTLESPPLSKTADANITGSAVAKSLSHRGAAQLQVAAHHGVVRVDASSQRDQMDELMFRCMPMEHS